MSMFPFWKKKKQTPEKQKEKNSLPYEKREKVEPLSLFFTIVNRNQSRYYVDAYSEAGASMSLVEFGYSNPPEEIRSILGPDSLKKDIVITLVRSSEIEKLMKIAATRFKISSLAKGIAFACPIDSVSGIAVYRFLSDAGREERKKGEAKK